MMPRPIFLLILNALYKGFQMRYHLFHKFFGKIVKIKETSFLSCFVDSLTHTTVSHGPISRSKSWSSILIQVLVLFHHVSLGLISYSNLGPNFVPSLASLDYRVRYEPQLKLNSSLSKHQLVVYLLRGDALRKHPGGWT